jgi:putative glycosyltransferase (TIGR04372 family)
MRDAKIDDYLPAIDLIVKRGGWVIRMGDASMKPLPPLPNVIDYAHSTLKTPKADMFISLGCRFFLGTNSGFATVPAIYGVRCVFSNWLPIGLPFWPSHSLLMPKLFWNEEQARYLTLEEVFKTGLAFIQNWSDLPADITLRDNAPEEIRDLANEALGLATECTNERLDEARTAYSEIANTYGSYVGSTLAASFIRRHRQLLLREEEHTGEETRLLALPHDYDRAQD